MTPPRGSQVLHRIFSLENLRIFPVRNDEAYAFQSLHVALSSGPLPRNYCHGIKFSHIPWGHKLYMGLYRENFQNLPIPNH